MSLDILSYLMGKAAGGGASPYTVLEPLHADFNGGYLGSATQWYYEANSTFRNDIYQLEAGKHYLIHLGSSVGNRFRVAYFDVDPYTVTSNLTGNAYDYWDDPPAYAVATSTSAPRHAMLTPAADCFLVIQKTSASVDGIKTYVSEFIDS